jgi:tripartite-type tricarboxylate transporter receptor subunit TctC
MVPRQLDKIGLRTPGAGTPMHFLGVMLATAGGVTYLHVPYQGSGPATQERSATCASSIEFDR